MKGLRGQETLFKSPNSSSCGPGFGLCMYFSSVYFPKSGVFEVHLPVTEKAHSVDGDVAIIRALTNVQPHQRRNEVVFQVHSCRVLVTELQHVEN